MERDTGWSGMICSIPHDELCTTCKRNTVRGHPNLPAEKNSHTDVECDNPRTVRPNSGATCIDSGEPREALKPLNTQPPPDNMNGPEDGVHVRLGAC
jgi:hypothetical protein